MNPEALKSQISSLADYAVKHVELIADLHELSAAFYAATLRINAHITTPVRPMTEPLGLLSGLADLPRGDNVVELAGKSPNDSDPETAA
ncbi:hypothetical protein [Bradyrhizobium sp. CCBAU 53421]|uniref:hypothetical protein n=1 Tax=Bradyrhizobium sp. CCBAU 53421 TaxID=1325120 RepID=UPI00188D87F0|nr:hypothetical protein [Bradyrhizobium sp. CCBAU 53421]QOZ34433.1 hypothetical protein XH92_24515 [Bradyrhizobium sp. CCBAU 53421]